MMYLGNENWSTTRLSLNIHGIVHTLKLLLDHKH